MLKIHIPPVEIVLDPHRMEDAFSMSVILQMNRGLFRYNPDGEVVNDLVETWKTSAKETEFRFTLRPATFSDGTPITAHHVVNSLNRLFKVDSLMASDLRYISGGITATGPKEVTIQLKKPSALLLKHLAAVDCAILPIDDAKKDLKFNSTTPTSGPYRIEKMNDNEVILTKWREDALDSKKPPQKIHYIETNEDPYALAIAGKTDSLDHDPLTPDQTKKLIGLGWRDSVTELIAERFVVMNPKSVDLPTRKYLFSKIDPRELAAAIGRKSLSPAFGVIPTGVPGTLSETDRLKLLAQKANPPKGKIRLEYATGGIEEIVPFLKKKWETPDFKVEIVPLTRAEALKKLFGESGEVLLGGKGLDYFDGYSVLTYFRAASTTGYFHVKDPQIDKALDKAVSLMDNDKRINAYQKLQVDILKHYTIIPLLFGSTASGLWSPVVAEVPPHPIGIHGLPLNTLRLK